MICSVCLVMIEVRLLIVSREKSMRDEARLHANSTASLRMCEKRLGLLSTRRLVGRAARVPKEMMRVAEVKPLKCFVQTLCPFNHNEAVVFGCTSYNVRGFCKVHERRFVAGTPGSCMSRRFFYLLCCCAMI